MRVGLLPAGADNGVVFLVVSILGVEDLVFKIFLEVVVADRAEKFGAFVRKKLGFDNVVVEVSLELPSGFLDRFGERKIIGSMFSLLSDSKVVALRFCAGEERAV